MAGGVDGAVGGSDGGLDDVTVLQVKVVALVGGGVAHALPGLYHLEVAGEVPE